MGGKLGEKSRKEKRKTDRVDKKKKRSESWVNHQKAGALKRKQAISKLKDAKNMKKPKNPSSQISEERQVLQEDATCVDDQFLTKQPKVHKTKRKSESDEINDDLTSSKQGKRKKTNFEQFLEMNMPNNVSADEDLKFERKLAKKLKVKNGALGGVNDDLNMLFEGLPSVFESLSEESFACAKETPKKRSNKETSNTKHGKKRENKEADVAKEAEVAGGTEAGVSKPVETIGGDVKLKEVRAKVPALKVTAKYVAPHLRTRVGNELEEHSQFRKRIRGLLNRLSESNVESITAEMSSIFQSVGRSVGSQIIGEEVLASCSGGPRGNEQYAAVFGAFVAGMACAVGIGFSAKILASLAKSFEDEYLEEDNLSLRNLTLLLSYLCIFGVCSSDLIYDFLIMLSKRLMESDVSTILTILQCCGMKLRSDDPGAMKEFLLSIQNRVNELKAIPSEDGLPNINSKRMEFMLETICDIKNNKKRSKDDPAHHTRIKKWLQKLRVEDILIRGIKWNKLLDPEKKGQWWLSGDVDPTVVTVEEVASTIDKEALEAHKMLDLAAKQRMNTDARKAIFCIIMSGEDYIDAFEKLLRLDLPGKQDREIMRVLVECCLREKVFNKYYTALASKLCNHDKNHKFTLQYCLWDHHKEVESMELSRSMNLSRFTAEMIMSFTLSISILKTVELSDTKQLTPKRIMHFRMLFEAIFEYPDSLIWNVFTRIAVAPELEILRNSLEFFIKEHVVQINSTVSDKFRVARKALNNVEGVLL